MHIDIHLIVGSTGSGKSTFARALAQRCGGMRFAIDEWMMQLFGPDRPEAADYDWYAPRIERSSEMIWRLVADLARLRTPSVLEVGLTQRAAREAFYERARAEGLRLKLHALDAPASLRWDRVEARNQSRGETFSLQVTRDMFDFVEQMWEAPDEHELREHAGERVDTSVRTTSASTTSASTTSASTTSASTTSASTTSASTTSERTHNS
jgi:predicted kinase